MVNIVLFSPHSVSLSVCRNSELSLISTNSTDLPWSRHSSVFNNIDGGQEQAWQRRADFDNSLRITVNTQKMGNSFSWPFQLKVIYTSISPPSDSLIFFQKKPWLNKKIQIRKETWAQNLDLSLLGFFGFFFKQISASAWIFLFCFHDKWTLNGYLITYYLGNSLEKSFGSF